jgi:hypothetical protein
MIGRLPPGMLNFLGAKCGRDHRLHLRGDAVLQLKDFVHLALPAIATIGLAATLSAAERPAWKFTEILPTDGQTDAAPDGGGMSSTTREELTGPSLYFVAHRAFGRKH